MTEVERRDESQRSGNRCDGKRHVGEHVHTTLGYRRVGGSAGRATVEWDASAAYGFPTAGGTVVQGGLVTAVLDAAMGDAAWTVLREGETFLTVDLRVEFFRSTRPGPVRAEGMVVRRSSRVVFCTADLYDEAGELLAASRCTQILLPATGPGGRHTGYAERRNGNDGPDSASDA